MLKGVNPFWGSTEGFFFNFLFINKDSEGGSDLIFRPYFIFIRGVLLKNKNKIITLNLFTRCNHQNMIILFQKKNIIYFTPKSMVGNWEIIIPDTYKGLS